MAVLRRAAFAGAVLLLVAACASSGASRPLSNSLPARVPSARARTHWQRIDGAYDAGAAHVRYALFVDPERPLLFRITQYRVSRRMAAGEGPRVDEVEIVIWNESPGEHVPLRCFAEEPLPHSWLSFARVRPSWRDVVPATEEFQVQMRRALEIYARVNAEGRAGPVVR
jgi:hypothetical protein